MRVRVAYISSLGTTAILVAAALLMLTLVGALVAFRGSPGVANGSGVQAVPLAPGASTPRAALVRDTATVRSVVRTVSATRVAHTSTAGLVKAGATGPRVVPGLVMVPVHPAPPMSSSPGRAPQGQAPNSTPDRQAAPDPAGPAPVPDPGSGLPFPPADPTASPPQDQITAMVGQMLSGAPPPPLLVAGVELPFP